MNALKAQEFAPMVTASILMDHSAASAPWDTTWISQECTASVCAVTEVGTLEFRAQFDVCPSSLHSAFIHYVQILMNVPLATPVETERALMWLAALSAAVTRDLSQAP